MADRRTVEVYLLAYPVVRVRSIRPVFARMLCASARDIAAPVDDRVTDMPDRMRQQPSAALASIPM